MFSKSALGISSSLSFQGLQDSSSAILTLIAFDKSKINSRRMEYMYVCTCVCVSVYQREYPRTDPLASTVRYQDPKLNLNFAVHRWEALQKWDPFASARTWLNRNIEMLNKAKREARVKEGCQKGTIDYARK